MGEAGREACGKQCRSEPKILRSYHRSPHIRSDASAHQASANRAFAEELRADSAYAARINHLFGTDLLKHMESGKRGLRIPWARMASHGSDPNSNWLRREVHRDPDLQDHRPGGNTADFLIASERMR